MNVPTLKGIHYAIESGIMAAEAAFRAPARGVADAARRLRLLRRGAARELRRQDLREVRNMRQAFDKGFYVGGARDLMTVTKGKLPPSDRHSEPNAARA